MIRSRRFVPHLLALASLAACAGAPVSSTPGREPTEGRVSRCVEAKAEARQVLASFQACGSDLDCVTFLQAYLGCDGVRSLASSRPVGLDAALVDACTGVGSRRLECSSSSPACRAGRCQAVRWPSATCPEAELAVRRAVHEPVACREDADCGELRLGSAVYGTGLGFGEAAAAELAAYRDACGRVAFEPGLRSLVRCNDRVCSSTPAPASTSPGSVPTGITKPRMRAPDCLVNQIAKRANGARPTGRHTVRFLVGPDGRPGFFQVEPGSPAWLESVLASSALACEFEPARGPGGEAIPVWLVVPLQFVTP